MTRLTLPVIVLCLLAGPGGAQVYKSVDAQGNVSYSSEPPAPGEAALVEQVPIAPPPSAERRREAEQRLDEIESEVSRYEQQRKEQAAQRRESVGTAEEALQRARSQLEQAKIQRDDDWQYLSTGGRVLNQGYFERVERAEQAVKSAEDALRKARGG